MKSSKATTPADQLARVVQLARLRVAKAESQLESAKARARLARRRRKEARQAARRARKQARQAKREFAAAQLELTEAEAKLARARRLAGSKTAKKPAAKAAVPPLKNKAPSTRSHKSVKPKRPAPSQRSKPSVRRKAAVGKKPRPVPRDLVMTVAPVALPERLEEPQTDETAAENPSTPSSLENHPQ